MNSRIGQNKKIQLIKKKRRKSNADVPSGTFRGRGPGDFARASTFEPVEIAPRFLVLPCSACAARVIPSLWPMSESQPSLALVGFDEDL